MTPTFAYGNTESMKKYEKDGQEAKNIKYSEK